MNPSNLLICRLTANSCVHYFCSIYRLLRLRQFGHGWPLLILLHSSIELCGHGWPSVLIFCVQATYGLVMTMIIMIRLFPFFFYSACCMLSPGASSEPRRLECTNCAICSRTSLGSRSHWETKYCLRNTPLTVRLTTSPFKSLSR